MLLTYNLRIRNTDPRFHLGTCYKKHFFGSQMKNAVSYMWDVTVYGPKCFKNTLNFRV